MALVIRELIVRATVSNLDLPKEVPAAADDTEREERTRAIVEECVEQVLTILDRREER